MASLRSLLVLLILIGLYSAATAVAQAPVEWYSGGGGVIAGPAPTNSRGGALAPSLATETTPAPAPGPTLPPPTAAPKSDDSPPAEAASASRATAARAARAPAARVAAAPASTALPSDDPLPFTGFELVAVVTAGLCLLLGGFALRPARR